MKLSQGEGRREKSISLTSLYTCKLDYVFQDNNGGPEKKYSESVKNNFDFCCEYHAFHELVTYFGLKRAKAHVLILPSKVLFQCKGVCLFQNQNDEIETKCQAMSTQRGPTLGRCEDPGYVFVMPARGRDSVYLDDQVPAR